MRDQYGKMIAFCSLMPTHFNDAISVDLIRWLPELDLPLMDGLYLHMLLWGQEKDIKRLIWEWLHFQMWAITLLLFKRTSSRTSVRTFQWIISIPRFKTL